MQNLVNLRIMCGRELDVTEGRISKAIRFIFDPMMIMSGEQDRSLSTINMKKEWRLRGVLLYQLILFSELNI